MRIICSMKWNYNEYMQKGCIKRTAVDARIILWYTAHGKIKFTI